MREIKFRGISKKHNSFEFGDLITSIGQVYIGNTVGNHPENWCEVYPESVGQFTGLTDKNGVEIYEGDKTEAYEYVVFEDGIFGTTYEGNQQGISRLSAKRCENMEVIGNIHQNKELI